MATLNRDGINIHYEVHGAGPAVLLSHGYSATSEMWRGQIEPFSRSHKLIVWDMRGHGKSDYPEDPTAYSETATVSDRAAILDAVGEQRAVIGGLSLGGYMSLAFHLAHPERTRALLIIDTGPGYKNDVARHEWNESAERTAVRYESRGVEGLGSGSVEMRTAQHRDVTGLVRAARGMLAQRDSRVINSLAAIAVPTLVVVGSEDKPFLAASDYMATKIRGAAKVVIPGAGHAANIDQPEAFNAAVLTFLDQVGVR